MLAQPATVSNFVHFDEAQCSVQVVSSDQFENLQKAQEYAEQNGLRLANSKKIYNILRTLSGINEPGKHPGWVRDIGKEIGEPSNNANDSLIQLRNELTQPAGLPFGHAIISSELVSYQPDWDGLEIPGLDRQTKKQVLIDGYKFSVPEHEFDTGVPGHFRIVGDENTKLRYVHWPISTGSVISSDRINQQLANTLGASENTEIFYGSDENHCHGMRLLRWRYIGYPRKKPTLSSFQNPCNLYSSDIFLFWKPELPIRGMRQ
jgi:hypothetical protein